MKLSRLNQISTAREHCETFKGYNHNLRIGYNEFYDEENMTSDFYPVLSPRGRRGELAFGISVESDDEDVIVVNNEFKFAAAVKNEMGTYVLSWSRTSESAPGEWKIRKSTESADMKHTISLENYGLEEVEEPTSAVVLHITYGSKNIIAACGSTGNRIYYAVATIEAGVYMISLYKYEGGEKQLLNSTPFSVPVFSKSRMFEAGAYIIFACNHESFDETGYNDMYIINTITHEVANADAYAADLGAVTLVPCDIDGNAITISYAQDTNPCLTETVADGAYWVDTSDGTKTLKQYSSVQVQWVSVATSYFKMVRTRKAGWPGGFKEGDAVYMDNIPEAELENLNGKYSIIQKRIEDSDNDEYGFVFIGVITDEINMTVNDDFVFKREMPYLDYIIECKNRLWGCRYGEARDGSFVNEIYCSKLGDFTNWNVFEGISTDSYVASCGTAGKFTGAINYGGYPLFFKEERLHKVFGDYPSNYQVQDVELKGVAEGASNSLAIVNNVLYYKGVNSVLAYAGSLPSEISYALGNNEYVNENVWGVGHKNKYHLFIREKNGGNVILVYDTKTALWHREKGLKDKHAVQEYWLTPASVAEDASDVYVFYVEDSSVLHTLYGSGVVKENRVRWLCETGILGMDTNSNGMYPERKYIDQIVVRMSLALGGRVNFFIQYDSQGEYEFLATVASTNLKTFDLPIRPRRCDHFRLKIVGEGECKIFSLTKVIQRGDL